MRASINIQAIPTPQLVVMSGGLTNENGKTIFTESGAAIVPDYAASLADETGTVVETESGKDIALE